MSRRAGFFQFLFAAAFAVQVTVVAGADDPYRALASSSTADTAAEAFLPDFSVSAASRYLDERAHLAEKNCYACHSTFTYLTARSLIDPLADEVMQTRVMLERFTEKCLDPKTLPTVKTQHIAAVRILVAVELARHDAVTTGKLRPLTRAALDAIWKVQLADGGLKWLHVREAPQAIDDWWPATMTALGVAAAPDDYAKTPSAAAGLEKLRGWFLAHPPQTNHERALTLLADQAIGGIVKDEDRRPMLRDLLSDQRDDGGWSMASLAPWQRPDKKPLDPNKSDGYATGVTVLALVRGGPAGRSSGGGECCAVDEEKPAAGRGMVHCVAVQARHARQQYGHVICHPGARGLW